MLQKLNERIQGLVSWIIIGLIAVTFTLFGVDYYMQSRQASDAVAEVNGEALTRQAMEVAWRRARAQRDLEQMTSAAEKRLKAEVMEESITNLITLQAAKANGFSVNAAQANAAIVNIPQFQQDGKFSPERFQVALSGALFTPESFQTEVLQGMLLNQQRFTFMGSAFALPDEVKRFVKLYMQTRDYAWLRIPAAQFLDKKTVSEEEVAAWYKAHQDTYLSPEQVQIEYLSLSVPEIRKTLSVDQEQVARYYEENRNNYLKPARWKVAHILFAVPEGASAETRAGVEQRAEDAWKALNDHPEQFPEWVKTTSDDQLSAASGGVLPWITAGQSEYAKSFVNLVQPGQITKPMQTQHGYEIFRLISYQPASVKSLQDVEQEIHDQLLAELAQTKFSQLLEQLADLAYQTPDTLKAASDALKLPVKTATPFSREPSGSDPLASNRQIVNAAFSHDVLDLGNNSEPLQLDQDTVIVLRVAQHIPAEVKPLEKVHANIVNTLALQKAGARTKEIGMTLLSAPEKQTELMDTYALAWTKVDRGTREGDSSDPAINDLAFTLSKTDARDGRSLPNGDFVIVALEKIHDGDFDALDKEQRASISQQIESGFGVMDYDLFVSGLLANAKIVRNPA